MESQNHYYGHSRAFAHYLGTERPRHIAGLVQHGWTALSPVETHFRDFPWLTSPSYRGPNRLLVWSHRSRAWDPRSTVPTTAVGAPFAYESLSRGLGSGNPGSGTVILPVHGIETQAISGDHRAAARRWFDSEGPSTVSIYWSDARDERLVDAYRDAGHRCVTLGPRTDPDFLARLVALIAGSARVVSNRLSTPVVYAAWLGRSVGVYGDPMLLDSEDPAALERLERTWPELYGYETDGDAARAVATDELGAGALLEPDALRRALGWDRRRVAPFVRHWTTSPAERALVNVRRRGASSPPAPVAAASASPGAKPASGIDLAWLRAATSYLPRPLGGSRASSSEAIVLDGSSVGV
ncbi:hypothetical protein [Cellulosimicrobium cellulans]|uniref:hypothetical protein n=1 Tax=Cellulosimicrobium cellulans TaxID=1710 RepID=UPI0037FA1F20